MTTTTPDYVATTLDQAEKVRDELVSTAKRGYGLATGAVQSTVRQAKPAVQQFVDLSFTAVEKIVDRSHAFANSLVAASSRIGA